jgi:GNAT superfamily N-acetyltransferase
MTMVAGDIAISLDPARLDITAIHAFLTGSYWSPGVPADVVALAVAGSVCVGAFDGSAQIGFARLVTDRATFAYLADVYVLEPYRGRGLARQMLDALFDHAQVRGLRRMLLVTRDAHDLYAKYGFTPLAAPDRFMELHRPDLYRAPGA